MTLAVNDYVEIANPFCELSTLDTLGNCDSLNKKDETRRQFGPVQDRQDKVSEFSLSRIIVSNHYFQSAELEPINPRIYKTAVKKSDVPKAQPRLEKFSDRADAERKGDEGEKLLLYRSR